MSYYLSGELITMYQLIRTLLFLLPAESAHHASLVGLSFMHKLGLLTSSYSKEENPITVMGIRFPNRVGLAAGLDKNGDYFQALSTIGFGFVEIGTVTPRPQSGNPAPRLFRLPKAKAIINRMGFNNEGIDHLLTNVESARQNGFKGIIGINIGKNFDTAVDNATADYLICLRAAYLHADYITINISSPNTPGLRTLQYGKELDKLLSAIKNEQLLLEAQHSKYTPITVKVAPDLNEDEIKDIAEILIKNKMDALIATNTTLSRDAVSALKHGDEAGGLSGLPVKDMSNAVIREFHKHLKTKLPIIGVGGIFSYEDAQEKLDAGADLVQIYTGFIYQGPNLIHACQKISKT